MNEKKVPVAVIILTYNEEPNISLALDNVVDWADQVFIVDSYSTDKTLEIAREHKADIFQNPYTHWAQQRNWAMDNLPFKHDWILFLDADERLSDELKEEIGELFNGNDINCDGYYINRYFVFMNKVFKHGGYNKIWVLRLLNRHKGKVIGDGAREYIQIEGKAERLKNIMLHKDEKDINSWIIKHNSNATMEAINVIEKEHNATKSKKSENKGKESEGHMRIWIRENIWKYLPKLIRPFLYFFYRYFLRFGFLDGKAGFIYMFLHEFWFTFLTDVKYIEIKQRNNQAGSVNKGKLNDK